MLPRIKYIFVLEIKPMFRLIRKLFLSFTQFSNLISLTQIICCIIHRYLYCLLILFCSLVSVSNKQTIETMLTLPYPYNWLKFNNKMNENRSQEYQSMDPECVTGKINSCILQLLLRQFCCIIFSPPGKS